MHVLGKSRCVHRIRHGDFRWKIAQSVDLTGIYEFSRKLLWHVGFYAKNVTVKDCVAHPTHLRTSFLKQFYLKNKGVEYVQVPFPGSPPLSISKFSGMKGQINVQNVNLAFIFYPCYSFFTRCNRAQFVPKKKVAWHVHNLAAPSFFASERTEMVAWTLEIPIWSGFASIIQMLTREDAE